MSRPAASNNLSFWPHVRDQLRLYYLGDVGQRANCNLQVLCTACSECLSVCQAETGFRNLRLGLILPCGHVFCKSCMLTKNTIQPCQFEYCLAEDCDTELVCENCHKSWSRIVELPTAGSADDLGWWDAVPPTVSEGGWNDTGTCYRCQLAGKYVEAVRIGESTAGHSPTEVACARWMAEVLHGRNPYGLPFAGAALTHLKRCMETLVSEYHERGGHVSRDGAKLAKRVKALGDVVQAMRQEEQVPDTDFDWMVDRLSCLRDTLVPMLREEWEQFLLQNVSQRVPYEEDWTPPFMQWSEGRYSGMSTADGRPLHKIGQ